MFKFSVKLSSSLTAVAIFCINATSLQAADVTSWAELNTAKGDAEIVFANDIQATSTGYPSPITFTSAIDQTIDGNYHAFSSQDRYEDRWYYYSLSISKNGGILNLKNLGKFSNGDSDNSTFSYTDIDGNTVYKKIDASVNNWKGYFLTINKPITTNISNSVFTDNGKDKDAKLVYVSGSGTGTLNVTDSIFYNNKVANASGVVSGGKYNLNVENTVFYGNHNTTTSGGALYGSGNITVKNSYFINNASEKSHGGAISISGGAVLTIEGSRFEGNTSVDEGGAVSGNGSSSTIALIKDSQFINNHNGGSYYDGGAISLSGGYIQTVDNVLFEGNRAVSKGGGLYEGMNGSNTKPAILIKDTIFKDNEASTGGGYYTDGQGRKNYTYITDSEFTNNIARATGHYMEFGIPVGGGMISAGKVPIVINNTTFTGNTAIADGSSAYSAGGGIYFAGESASYPLKIVDSTFTDNSALEGGAIFIQNADTAIIADTIDVEFSGNTAEANTDTYNGGDDIYFQTDTYGTLSLNAAEDKKIIFNGSVAAYTGTADAAIMDINNTGVTYNTYDGTTETVVDAGTAGEIQFNNKVGDEEGNIFNINLYGGTLSIGQNETVNATVANPDGFINNNNFTVAGDATLNTANGVIGEFAPQTFEINAALEYQFDVDLAGATSDKLTGATNNGSLTLSVLNIISDTNENKVKVVYSDTNINGVLKDDYTITTSTASYDVTAGNDDTGSYMLVSKSSDTGGLPNAIKNGSDAYSITSGTDEVIETWKGSNSLKADLVINGNNHGIKTENSLNGINIGSDYTLTMNNVSDMSGFNYALNNEGTVNLTNTTIQDEIINNGTLEINRDVSLGAISGSGTTNINADYELQAALEGNTVNVKNATLSGVSNLADDVDINAIGGVVAIDNQAVTVNSANFDSNSTLSLSINSLSEHGQFTAQSITVEEGAKLQATLAQGLVAKGDTASLQLLSANNEDFDNFNADFDNNMYHFEKADTNGNYNITLVKTAEDVVEETGTQAWVAEAAKAYIDGDSFEEGSTAADVANKLAALAQNNSAALVSAIKAIAPTETEVVQDIAISETNRLFKTVDNYLRGERDLIGMSSGDMFSDVSIWAKPYVGQAKVHSTDRIEGQESKSTGVIAGLEKKTDLDLKLGLGLHYDKTEIDALKRDIDAKTLVGFIYGEYKPSNWFVNAIASYGQSDYDEYKYALGSTYTADYDVHTTSVATTLGYQFKNFVPEASMRYYYIKRAGYKDTASQHIHASSTNYLRTTAGVRFMKEYGRFMADIYMGLGYDITKPKNNTYVSLNNGTHYIVEGKNLSRFEYELNLGLQTYITDRMLVGATYMGAYRKNYQEHTGIIRLKYSF